MKICDVVLAVIRALVLIELIREVAGLAFGGVVLAIYVSGLESAHTALTSDIAKTVSRTQLTTGVLGALEPIAISLFILAISRRLARFIVRTMPASELSD